MVLRVFYDFHPGAEIYWIGSSGVFGWQASGLYKRQQLEDEVVRVIVTFFAFTCSYFTLVIRSSFFTLKF